MPTSHLPRSAGPSGEARQPRERRRGWSTRWNEYAPPPPTPRRPGWEPGGAAARELPFPLRAARGPVIRPDASEVPVDHPNPVWPVVPSGIAITGARAQSPSAGRNAGGSLRNNRRWNDGPRAQAEVARDSRSPRREGDRGNARRPAGDGPMQEMLIAVKLLELL